MKKQVNQHGDKSVYIEGKVDNIYFDAVKTQYSLTEIMQTFYSASVDLSSYNNHFAGSVHIARTETNDLYTWILNDVKLNESPIAVLGGNAGYGKSVILRDLYDKLNENKIPVLGIKADRLFIHNLSELNDELNLGDNIESIFKTLSSNYSRYVFIIDQIDALSQSLSSDRNTLNTYHSLILKLSRIRNIRIIISCRLYDLDYDPLLQEYKNKKVFMTSLLSISDVEDVLNKLNLQIISTATNVKEFLRVPLHLQLFSIIKKPAKFEGNVSPPRVAIALS